MDEMFPQHTLLLVSLFVFVLLRVDSSYFVSPYSSALPACDGRPSPPEEETTPSNQAVLWLDSTNYRRCDNGIRNKVQHKTNQEQEGGKKQKDQGKKWKEDRSDKRQKEAEKKRGMRKGDESEELSPASVYFFYFVYFVYFEFVNYEL